MALKKLALAAVLAVVSFPVFADESQTWIVAPDGWAIQADMKCDDVQLHSVTCQVFREGTVLSDENVAGMTRADVLKMHPGLDQFLDESGVFSRNVVAQM